MKIDITAARSSGLKLDGMTVGEVYERIGSAGVNRFYIAVGPQLSAKATTIVNLGTGNLLVGVDGGAEFRHVPDAKLVLP